MTDRQTESETGTHTDIETDRQSDRQDSDIERLTDSQRGIETGRQTTDRDRTK